jgi:hypothetical protein
MPLTRIFHPQKSFPTLYATKMLHYAQFMSGFHYDIVYRKTEDYKNVDFLSRFPLPCKNDESSTENDASKDNELRDLCFKLQTGKRSMNPELLSKFSLHNGIVFNDVRVVIPKSLQQKVLRELHVRYCGITRMKALAFFVTGRKLIKILKIWSDPAETVA